jgi:hypothetical protein
LLTSSGRSRSSDDGRDTLNLLSARKPFAPAAVSKTLSSACPVLPIRQHRGVGHNHTLLS